jgi:hypothetical protein
VFPDQVFHERQELANKMASAPSGYLANNLAALMRLLREFEASLVLELQVIQGVKRLDVSDSAAVRAYVDRFSDYVAQRAFNLERTSCSAIRRIYQEQLQDLQEGSISDTETVEDLEHFVESFAYADAEFTEEIEQVMERALKALQEIDALAQANQTDDARTRQQQFNTEYEGEPRRLKHTIRVMSDAGNRLVEAL